MLRDAPEGLGLQQFAAPTNYVPSSVHRILTSLKRHGYVPQDAPGGAYTLGLQLLGFAHAMRGRSASPARDALTSASLSPASTKGRTSRCCTAIAGSSWTSRRRAGTSASWVRSAPTCTSTRSRLTPRTIATRVALERECARVRRSGVAINKEETIVGAVFVAAPVFDASRAVCGAISVGIHGRYLIDINR